MKKSIIEQIFYDKLNVCEEVELSEEYKKISDEAFSFYKQLKCILNDEQKKIFQKYIDSEMGVCAEGELLYFREGFKLGMLLAIECLT